MAPDLSLHLELLVKVKCVHSAFDMHREQHSSLELAGFSSSEFLSTVPLSCWKLQPLGAGVGTGAGAGVGSGVGSGVGGGGGGVGAGLCPFVKRSTVDFPLRHAT